MPVPASPEHAIKILVVDGDRAFHGVAAAAVQKIPSAQVMCCANPAEALHRLDQFIPTVVIVDGQLNGAAGINFVKRIRNKQTPAPEGTLVMFVAKEFTGGLSGRMCDAGCHGVVRKPLSAEALGRAIARMLSTPVPFVLGGNYLGPDRRAEGESKGREPDRRRTASRGGWTGTPPLFYRPAPSAASGAKPSRPPAWKRPPTETAAKPAARPPRVASAEPAAAAAAARPDAESIVPATANAPAPETRDIEPLPPVAPAPARPKVRDLEPLAPAASEQSAGTTFDLDAVVALHREWIASGGTSGIRANLADMQLSGAKLANQNLSKANFRGANLMGADMRLCVLIDADLRNACLAQALLNEAQLAGAKIRHADLQFAQLPAAGLQGSDLAGADLRGAVLAGADLAGANLLATDIRGADLTAINLTQKQLDRASGDATTQLPPGLFVARPQT